MHFYLYDSNGPIKAIPETTAVTVGVFDGVHRGHQALIAKLVVRSKKLEVAPMAITLTAHPSFVLGRRDNEYWLDDSEEHLRLLFQAGMKYVAVLPFTHEVASLTACQMAQTLYTELHMRALLLGYDSRFGSKSNDDFDRLPELASELGFELHRGEPFLIDNAPISSSRIRESLLLGAVEETAILLGRSYSITGTVLHGRGVGRTIGFPTANISLESTRKMLPKEGVYTVKVDGNIGMANLGTIPTYGINESALEVHLLNYNDNLYGQTVTVEFIHRLRDIMQFDSPEALQYQLQHDLEQTKQWL